MGGGRRRPRAYSFEAPEDRVALISLLAKPLGEREPEEMRGLHQGVEGEGIDNDGPAIRDVDVVWAAYAGFRAIA
jgi:hypothetical protein